jgi:hypothetical protein
MDFDDAIINWSWCPMITKTIFTAKVFRAYGTNFFRQEKSLRDHGDAPGRRIYSDVTRAR